jgi:hypothetical protein
MDMPEEFREAGAPQVLTEGDIDWGPGLQAALKELQGDYAGLSFEEAYRKGAEEIHKSMMEGGAFGPAGGGIGLMTRPEWFRNIYRTLEKEYGAVSPEIAQRLRDFINKYPAEVLDKLKWFREVPREMESKAMTGVWGRYWTPDVRRSVNLGKYPKSTHGVETSPEGWEYLKKLSEGTEGPGYFAVQPHKRWKSETDIANTHIHETLHHLERELRQAFNEDEVLKAGGELASGKLSPYFDRLMTLWEKVKTKYH